MSRYLQQLMYESSLNIDSIIQHNPVQPRQPQPIIIQKDETVRHALAALNEVRPRSYGLSPSALNTYLECRLKFYFQYVARIREPQQVEEEIDARVLGNFLHTVMERFYRRIVDKRKTNVIVEDDFEDVDHQLNALIDEAFIDGYHLEKGKAVAYEGQRVVVFEVVKKFAANILEKDRLHAPFTIEALEQRGWNFSEQIDHAPGLSCWVAPSTGSTARKTSCA